MKQPKTGFIKSISKEVSPFWKTTLEYYEFLLTELCGG